VIASVVVSAVLAVGGLVPGAPEPGCWDTAWRCQDIVDYRGTALDQSRGLQDEARGWARHMADDRVLEHSFRGSEIVGYGPDWLTIKAAWEQSTCTDGSWPTCPGHRELLLDPDFTRIGVGCSRSTTGTLYCAVRFE
jgi:hypothetical protein